jgi:hypothetical protein
MSLFCLFLSSCSLSAWWYDIGSEVLGGEAVPNNGFSGLINKLVELNTNKGVLIQYNTKVRVIALHVVVCPLSCGSSLLVLYLSE